MANSYLPSSDSARVQWLNNFSAHLSQYSFSLGISPSEVQSVQQDAAMYAYLVQLADNAHQYSTVLYDIKRQIRNASVQAPPPALPVPPGVGAPPAGVNTGIFNRISLLVARIKQSAAYNTAIGQDLNIIPPTVVINPADMAPVLSVRLDAGHPLLKWKKGDADALQLYVDRRDTNGFVTLARTTHTSYLDTRSVDPETFTATWDYKAKYVIGDDEVGQFSALVSVNVVRTA